MTEPTAAPVEAPALAGPARLLVAEDDDLTRELLATALRRVGHEVRLAEDGQEALELLGRERFDLLLCDVQMPRRGGLSLLEATRRSAPDLPVVILTAYADPGAAMDAIGGGATDFLAKPVDVVALAQVVARSLERRRLAPPPVDAAGDRADGEAALVGTSAALLDLSKQLARVAPTDATVLVTGESGAGKELVARALHRRSRRGAGPFLAVNCATIADSLLEAELFGHERGAFTGAHAARRGLFEEASGGTLLLDEVGDVPPRMQATLLRVLQEGEVRRIGSARAVPVDVRVVAATHRDLEAEVAAGRLRADLYYRLAVVTLRVPPLRERPGDVALLARHLLLRQAARQGRPAPALSPAALALLEGYGWPGNVRELANALTRAAAVSEGGVITPADLPALVRGAGGRSAGPTAPSLPPSAPSVAASLRESSASPALAPPSPPAPGTASSPSPAPRPAIDHDWPTLAQLERRYMDKVLARTGGNKTAAAALLGVDRRTLQRLYPVAAGDDER